MISAATGAMALLMVTLVKDHGLQYLLATTVLTGVLQIVAGALKLGSLMRFVSRSVVTGFVNALAILIFLAQLPELTHVTWVVYAMTGAGSAIIYGFPYITKVVPSPLVTIVELTGVAMVRKLDIRTVGLLESMMTASIVDDLTDTLSNKNRECVGQGAANIATGFIGGMAGCAMIGQSVINVKSGGRLLPATTQQRKFLSGGSQCAGIQVDSASVPLPADSNALRKDSLSRRHALLMMTFSAFSFAALPKTS